MQSQERGLLYTFQSITKNLIYSISHSSSNLFSGTEFDVFKGSNYLKSKAMKCKVIFVFISILLLTGCEKEDSFNPRLRQQVLFQIEYVNYAWGYQHSGIIIDSTGNVGYFKFPENWNSPDKLGYITESEMNENLRQLRDINYSVRRDTLLNYFSMVETASKGELTDPYNRMFDAGTTVYSGYLYYPTIKKYKQVLIKQWGDWSIDNQSPEAGEIFRWLRYVYNDVYESMRQ